MKRLKPLIGVCGAAGSGKDTLAEGIAAMDVYFVYHFADPIKNAINAMFGFGPVNWENRDWKEEPIDWLQYQLTAEDVPEAPAAIGEFRGISPRYLAQTLGTEWGRKMVDEQIWLKIAQQKFNRVNTTAQMDGGRIIGLGMIIPDVRFDNEAQWIKDAGGLLLQVDRPGQEIISEDSHASEAGIDPALIDAVITNDGPPSKMIMAARKVLWESSGLSAASQAD
jgi:hypothetical protein